MTRPRRLHALWQKITPTPDPGLYSPLPADPAPGEALQMTYLGTAGFVLEQAGHVLALDPYVTRSDLTTTLTQPLQPDAARIAQLIPRCNDVLVGHAHYDHVLDAPELCRQTGARLIGSRAVCMVGRAAGLPESQLLETAGREDLRSGDWTVRGLPSVHGKAAFGRIPLPGDHTCPPPWPPRFFQLKHGLVLNWLVRTPSLTVAHIDSADFLDEELQGHRCDVLCLCAIGRQYRPGYARRAIELLRPRWVVPCHWDTMITPMEQPPGLFPGVDLAGFVAEIRAAGAEAVVLPLQGQWQFFPPAP